MGVNRKLMLDNTINEIASSYIYCTMCISLSVTINVHQKQWKHENIIRKRLTVQRKSNIHRRWTHCTQKQKKIKERKKEKTFKLTNATLYKRTNIICMALCLIQWTAKHFSNLTSNYTRIICTHHRLYKNTPVGPIDTITKLHFFFRCCCCFVLAFT